MIDREARRRLVAAVMTVYSDPHLTWPQARAKLAEALNEPTHLADEVVFVRCVHGVPADRDCGHGCTVVKPEPPHAFTAMAEPDEEWCRVCREHRNHANHTARAEPETPEQSEDTDVVNAVTEAMREADRVFENVGGSTRHHVRDCLLPVLNRNGWRVARAEPETPPTVLDEVAAERVRQDAKWGGPAHDDTHTLFEWWGFIRRRMVGRAVPDGKALERRDMIQVAALAVACVESMDRKGDR